MGLAASGGPPRPETADHFSLADRVAFTTVYISIYSTINGVTVHIAEAELGQTDNKL
ncbi:MAG: hypothetical protein JWN14_413 [Chthonomonadales bacterium]|nr:hypothetical protein [Chthonomonadales bacterium]